MARNLDKPGISRLFPHRIVLRIQEMLQQIRRGGLPGVLNASAIKTSGTVQWQGFEEAVRFYEPAEAAVYGRLGAHAIVTLFEGTKGQKDAKTQADAATVRRLSVHSPSLTADQEMALEAARAQAVRQARLLMKAVGKTAVAVKRKRMAEPSEEVEEEVVEPLPADVATSSTAQPVTQAGQPVAREASTVSRGSSTVSGETEGWDRDGDLSEADSRCSVATDDSFEGTEAETDPFGMSPDLDQFGDSDGEAVSDRESCPSDTIGEY